MKPFINPELLYPGDVLEQFKPAENCAACDGTGQVKRDSRHPRVVLWDFCQCVKVQIEESGRLIRIKEK